MIIITRSIITMVMFLFLFNTPLVFASGMHGWHNHHKHFKHFKHHKHFKQHRHHYGKNKHLVLKLLGTGFKYTMQVPGMEEGDDPMDAMCFDNDLINVKNNRVIGTGTDCLSNVQFDDKGNITVIATTFFNLPGGTLITRGNAAVQPVPGEVTLESEDGQTYTHITGALSSGNTIIGGTGKYENSTGRARLSGMVDMSQFNMKEHDPLAFNCLFVVDVELN